MTIAEINEFTEILARMDIQKELQNESKWVPISIRNVSYTLWI